MNVRVATVLYAIAVAAIPIGVASKFLLGITGAIWIDPTLLVALAALLALSIVLIAASARAFKKTVS